MCINNHVVVLLAIQLPELDKDESSSSIKLVLNGDIRPDLIVGADFLTKSGMNIK